MDQQKVTSTIKKNPFNYNKAKVIAKMLVDGFDKYQISQACISKNSLHIVSFSQRREMCNEIYRRLLFLDFFLLKSFLEMDLVTSKFVLLYAIAKSDQLFFEFLSETFRNALLGEKKYISMDDFDLFFITKKETHLTVSGWSKATIEQLSKGYRKLLVDSGLGIRQKKNIYVKKLIIHPEIIKYLKKVGDYKYLQAILGER